MTRDPFEAATAHDREGAKARAMEGYLRVLPSHPRYRDACVRLVAISGEDAAVTLDFENFIASFIRSGPRGAAERGAFLRLARRYVAQGFPENAVEALQKLVEADPSNREAGVLLATLGHDLPESLPDLPEPPPLPSAEDLRAGRALVEIPDRPIFDVGATIANRYRLDEKIGRGGNAVVFRCHDLLLGEAVALKVFTEAVYDEEMEARFKRELTLSRQLAHPNVVRVYDLGFFQGFRYLTMELLTGIDLRGRMGPALSLGEILGYLVQACAGLQAAHDAGIVHRDVKPENCFITAEGALKVMDFGLAKIQAAPGVTSTGIIAGTPTYMAPEQIMNFRDVAPAADLYSMGVMAYEMATGVPPFQHPESMPLMLMHVHTAPVPPRVRNPALPEAFEEAILRCLEKDPARRFPSCRDLGRRLEEIRVAVAARA